MAELTSCIYNKKRDEIPTEEDLYDNEHDLFMLLERYAIFKGYAPKKYTLNRLYRFYSKEIEFNKKLKTRESKTIFLLRIARILERNQHKQFDLQDLINKG